MRSFNEDTKLIARLYPTVNTRGLNIYNPYFEASDVNAAYMLFHSPDLRQLLCGMRDLNLAGAIPAGFEGDPQLPELLDELSPQAERLQRVSVIAQRNGKLVGLHNGGYGLYQAVSKHTDIDGQDICIIGAGNVTKALLGYIDSIGKTPASVSIYNRTKRNAELVNESYPVDDVGDLQDMFERASGSVLINTSTIGAPWHTGEDVTFSVEFLQRFDVVADVCFVPLEPPLISAALQAGCIVAPGWQMFVHQGAQAMRDILGVGIDIEKLSALACADFEHNWS